MSKNSGSDFGGVLKNGKSLRLRSLKTRDDMSIAQEDYHTGLPATVPFMWESEPGTPKANFSQNGAPLSPLTPPPSYFSTPSTPQSHDNCSSKPGSSATNFFNSVFRKLSVNKASFFHPLSSPGSTPSSSSTPKSASAMSFDSRVDEDEDREDVESPVSTLFFGNGRGAARDEGCYPKLVKVFSRDSK